MSTNLHGKETRITFGKYADKEWSKIPTSYLEWLVESMKWQITHRGKDKCWGSTLIPIIEKELTDRKK